MSDASNNGTANGHVAVASHGGQGGAASDLLDQRYNRLASDLRMVERAVRRRWPVSVEKRPALVERLHEIADKREVAVTTKSGEVLEVDGPADANAIKAIAILRLMETDNQADELEAMRSLRDKPTGPVNIQVNQPREFRLEFDRSG